MTDPMSRFWPKVRIAGPDECWDWQGHVTPNGYGQVRADGRARGAHRVLMERIVGRSLERHEDVMHSCDRRCCVNPRHLSVGTRSDNVQDMHAKGRWAPRGPRHGEWNNCAKLTPETVREMRALRDEGFTLRSLREKFSVGMTTVCDVVHNRRWAHVA